MTKFRLSYTFTWEETRAEVLGSGLAIEGRATNEAIIKALRKWHTDLKGFGVPDGAICKLIVRKVGRKPAVK